MLKAIFLSCRGWLVFAYALLFIEFTMFALMPYVLGKAIDALLGENSDTLHLYIGLMTMGLLVGFIRRRMDSRIFMEIWRRQATSVVIDLAKRNINPAKIIVRSSNIKHFADFFEFYIPQAVSSFMTIVVAAIVICIELSWAAMAILTLVMLSLMLAYVFSNLIGRVESVCQATRESRESLIVAQDFSQVEQCYKELKRLYVRQSDLEASSWGLLDICAIAAEVIAVIALVRVGGTTGAIMATLAYVNRLFSHTGFFLNFFRQLKQMQIINEFLQKD